MRFYNLICAASRFDVLTGRPPLKALAIMLANYIYPHASDFHILLFTASLQEL